MSSLSSLRPYTVKHIRNLFALHKPAITLAASPPNNAITPDKAKYKPAVAELRTVFQQLIQQMVEHGDKEEINFMNREHRLLIKLLRAGGCVSSNNFLEGLATAIRLAKADDEWADEIPERERVGGVKRALLEILEETRENGEGDERNK